MSPTTISFYGRCCRIKSFEFADGAVSFNIPKVLTLSDCGFRCLITRFDHYSHLSKSYLPRQKVPEALAEPEEPVAETSKKITRQNHSRDN